MVQGELPAVRYLLDEQRIRQLALDSADPSQASRVMDIATSDAVLIHEKRLSSRLRPPCRYVVVCIARAAQPVG